MMSRPRSFAGFTLIEMIMVIVITGILAGMVAVFITRPIQGYVDSVRRAELTDQADVALRRMTRDVRLALPNSLRTVPNGFEFIMTKSGGRYRDPADGSTGGNFLSFTSATTTFDVLGPMPLMNGGDHVVVYNLGAGYTPADAYTGGNVATLGGTGAITANPVALTSNPFAAQSPPLPSPSARFQVVDQNDLVVRYVCDGTTLTRFSGCTLATPSTCAAPGAQLAGSAATCTIDFAPTATGRNGLLYIQLKLTDTPSDESVTLFQQIHVDNSP
ncbi:MAG: type II secretion system protein [Rhodocyclaceae bacterium]|nr:type II secretion system protein [Rhodocyclaceae bacterium]